MATSPLNNFTPSSLREVNVCYGLGFRVALNLRGTVDPLSCTQAISQSQHTEEPSAISASCLVCRQVSLIGQVVTGRGAGVFHLHPRNEMPST